MSKSLEILREILGESKPVSFREFVCSKDYCNNPDMYEFWYAQDEKLPEHLSELLISGSLGGGKSYYGNYKVAYAVYRLFLGGSPQLQLGLAADSEIFGFYFTVSLELAKQSGFTHLQNIFRNCKWFKENAPINENLKSTIDFVGKNFFIKAGSDFGHQLGLNVYIFVLDEANFREGVGQGMSKEYEEVTFLYQTLLDRQISRLSTSEGRTNAMAILISSASYQTSFMEKRKEAIKGDPNAAFINAIAYEIRPDRYSKEKFEVFIGCGSVEPCLVTNEQHKMNLIHQAGLDGLTDTSEFFRMVPKNLEKQFKTNIVLALQNHCGVSTLLQGSFMLNMKFLKDSYVSEDEIPPILQSEFLEASTADDTQLIEYLIPDNIQFPERPHCLFMDLSVQGDTGSLVCFRYDGNYADIDIHTKVFELKIIPPPFPAATKITKMDQFVIDLASYINIVAFGSDNFQSMATRQNVQAALGLEDIRVSIDSSDIPHNCWVRGLVEGKIRQKKSDLLEKETSEAVHDYVKHRVLKAKGSTDDTMQGNVGAYFLSSTFGKSQGTLEGLYPGRVNLVGGTSMEKMLKSLGYQQSE